ncbi:Phosphatidic acid phosphatase type 2/haloperoxidase [Phytophthora cactorum]|nr:Phosphatidic acid phosphatase type 2/haloperoxidase [Phytophthora cactorum]
MESITSVAELPGSESRNGGKWECLTRDYRAAEFAISVLMYGFALFFAKIQVAQREIPNIEVQLNSTTSVWARDPTINNKEKAQQVPMIALVGIGVGAPIIVNLFINYALPKFHRVRIIPHDTRDFFLTIVQSTSMATLLTQFTKNMTGRFRPCFYDMCKWNYDVVWDGVTNLCQSASGEKEGRKSFPSGHASFAFATMLVLTVGGCEAGQHAGVPLQRCHATSCKLNSTSSGITYASSGSLSTDQESELGKPTNAHNDYIVNVHNRANNNGNSPELSSTGEQYIAHGNLARQLREFRALEFSCTLVMFGLALFFACILYNNARSPALKCR